MKLAELFREHIWLVENIRRAIGSLKSEEAVERILDLFAHTKTNQEFIAHAKKTRFV